MTTKHKLPLIAAGLLLTMTACSDDDWTPGPAAPDNMCVYFTVLPPSSITQSNEDYAVRTATLTRNDFSEAVSVPLIVSSNVEGFSIPATVDFEAGQKNATVEIDFSNVPVKTNCELTVTVDPAYSNIYAAGVSSVSMSVYLSEWRVIADDVTYTFSPQNALSAYTNLTGYTLLNLEGSDLYIFKNFMNSGLDLKFSLGAVAYTSYRETVPESNFIWASEIFNEDPDDVIYYNGIKKWYLYDTAKGLYPFFTPDGSEPVIDYIGFLNYGWAYWYPSQYTDPDCYIGVNQGYASFYSYNEYDNGYGEYMYTNIYFTPLYDPFAVDGPGDATEE